MSNIRGQGPTYTYDSAGRFSYAGEAKDGDTKESWQYCYDPAGNLTSQGITEGCPRGTTYDVNDASQITAKNGTSDNWSYDLAGNETAAASTPAGTRTGETYTDFKQLLTVTVGGTTYRGQYASTDASERTKFGNTVFHNGPLGIAGQTTDGVDQGFIREPGGTLNSMNTGGKTYYYLTDALGSVIGLADESGKKVDTYSYSPRGVTRTAATDETVAQPFRFAGGYQDPTGLYHLGARYYDPNIGRFTQPDPSGQEKNPYLYAAGDLVNRIDASGTSWKATVEGCYVACVSGGLTRNSDGSLHASLGTGVGSPSVNGGLETSSADAGSGFSVNGECGAGSGTVSLSNSGDVSVGAGTEYHSDPECSVTGEYTW
ncbi:RHS repeat-associated core domain-containing protein [Streptomyces sp. NPDC059740]|uniref:RHS repeat-associated core domain-containing protein n=1 Tax=Streptomyces sp. NPDC059740 TaxID=3346926 RepID=UPI0036579865